MSIAGLWLKGVMVLEAQNVHLSCGIFGLIAFLIIKMLRVLLKAFLDVFGVPNLVLFLNLWLLGAFQLMLATWPQSFPNIVPSSTEIPAKKTARASAVPSSWVLSSTAAPETNPRPRRRRLPSVSVPLRKW